MLNSLEKFTAFFGMQLAHLLFFAAEETSRTLQEKGMSVQEALSAA